MSVASTALLACYLLVAVAAVVHDLVAEAAARPAGRAIAAVAGVACASGFVAVTPPDQHHVLLATTCAAGWLLLASAAIPPRD